MRDTQAWSKECGSDMCVSANEQSMIMTIKYYAWNICTLILGEISFFCLQNLSVTVAFAKGCLTLNNISYFRHDHTLAQKYKEI